MPILITGMHRSGTSMVARLLNLCGLYMGEPDEFMPARDDNPRGYWEHMLFLVLDKVIVNKLGHDTVLKTEFPILLQEGWENDERIKEMHLWARRLVDSMSTSAQEAPWGWKDPRACLLLPFWYSHVPDLRAVLCLRHPMDVVASLQVRDKDLDTEKGLWVWYTYYRMFVDHVKEYIVVEYDRFFWHPPNQIEIERLCDWVGLQPDYTSVEREIRSDLRHHETEGTDMLPEKIGVLYEQLLERGDG